MLNKIIIYSLLSYSSFALQVSFIGPCEESPLLTHHLSLSSSAKMNVGRASVQVLEELKIPYRGNAQGMNSIFDTVTGLEAMVVISDNEMHAYGWCYSVNGFEPASYPDQVEVSEDDHIVWWFGFAHYKNGKWIAQCTPSYTYRSDQFCSNE
jgi:hypothetical protein